jgi:ribosome-binding factor A
MNRRCKASRRPEPEGEALVEMLFDDDEAGSSHREDRKLKQLCREVFRALSFVLPEGLPDPELEGVILLDVVPAPDASRLAVQVQAGPGHEPAAVQDRLRHWKGRLRAEVAQAIQRKRTCDLVFEVLP